MLILPPHNDPPHALFSGNIKDICNLPADIGPCKSYILRYRFNAESSKCEFFTYGGCGGNANNFGSIKDCQETCRGE